MRLFMATLATETNTYSPLPTGEAAFAERFCRNDGSRQPPAWGNIPLIAWRRLAEAAGIEVVESICANAQPAGPTVRAVHERLRDLILDDLRAAPPCDIVLLNLHGAMVAEGCEDCEGDLIERVRAIVGPDVVIGIELDLHCHLTERMRTNATLIVAYKEYPHTDIAETAEALFPLAVAAAERRTRPVMAFSDLRMINMWHTPVEPMRGLVAEMRAAEGRDGVLSLSFGHGFPWGDVPDVGAKFVAIVDGGDAQKVADAWAARLWAMRHDTARRFDTPDASIDAALGAPRGGKPVVIAETSDNAGGGAPSDATFVLRRLVERGVRDVAIGLFWDPVAVSICREAGAGATLPLRIGGKTGTISGDPVDLVVTVRAVADEHLQTGLSGGRGSLGPCAYVEADGIHVVLVSHRQQAFHPDGFEGLGCTLADKRIVVVKSSQHFYAAFAPIAQAVRYCAAEGGMLRDFAKIPLTRIGTPWWPKDADPWGDNR